MHLNTVNAYLLPSQYKNSCDSSKDSIVTKILSQFPDFKIKNLLLVLFLSPKKFLF